MIRIICVGNRHIEGDSAGFLVRNQLREMGTPTHIEVIDGELGGLDLIRFLEDAKRVIFVDTVVGFDERGPIAILCEDEIVESATNVYDHAAGIPYMVKSLPYVLPNRRPEIIMVGVQGEPTKETVQEAARCCLRLSEANFLGSCNRRKSPGTPTC